MVTLLPSLPFFGALSEADLQLFVSSATLVELASGAILFRESLERFFAAAARRLPSLYVASVPLFAGLDVEVLQELDLESNWIRIRGGEVRRRCAPYAPREDPQLEIEKWKSSERATM